MAQASEVVVIVPTLNREKSLRILLSDIELQTLQPLKIIIVDSSDMPFKPEIDDDKCIVVESKVKSAAIQRNIGIDYIKNHMPHISYCAFLDDDVSLSSNYLEKLVKSIEEYGGAVGVSGIAISHNERNLKRNPLLDFIGLTGAQGSLTAAAINIPIRELEEVTEVEWLIGCSLWIWEKISEFRFEEDFMGQSIFEDVLFSLRVSKFGKLIVDSSVILQHQLELAGRPNDYQHYRDWVSNRYRTRSISPSKFKVSRFLLSNLMIFMKLIFTLRFRGAVGVFSGTTRIIKVK